MVGAVSKSDWRDQPQVRIRHDLCAPRHSNCSNNRHFLNNRRTETAAASAALSLQLSGLSFQSIDRLSFYARDVARKFGKEAPHADVTGVLLCRPPFMRRAIPSLIMSAMRLRLFAAMLSASLWPYA
jgi:hypothetical protein